MLTQYKIIKVNKYKGDNKKVNKNFYKSLPINNYTSNKIYNNELKTDNNNNSDKKNNINKYKLLNKLNETNLKNNSNIKSKSNNNTNNNYNTINVDKNINLIKNIRQNKYLIPIIEKKKNSQIFNKAKIKEAPFYISDFFSKVRQKSESNVIRSVLKKNNNNYLNRNRNINNDLKNIENENKTFSQKEINAQRNSCIRNINNNNSSLTERTIDINKYIHRKNPSYTGDNNINYKEERIIYPNIYENEMDNYSQNYYLKKINLSQNKAKRNDIINDFNNYLQHKKLFLIYRAKLFKILYKSLFIFLNKYFILLKKYAFQILKNYNKYKNNNLLNKEKNTYTLYQRYQKGINYKFNSDNKRKNMISRFNKFMDIKRKREKYGQNELKDNISKSCANFIRNKNLSEMKERKDKSEMCRSLSYLKEKYEEIQKRKYSKISENSKSNSFTNKDEASLIDKNKKIYYNNNSLNNLKGIYRKKRLECFNDRSDFLFANNKLKSTLNNIKNDFKKVKHFKKKSYGDLERQIFDYNSKSNKKQNKGEYILDKKKNIEQNYINNIKYKSSYNLKKGNDSKDLNKLNKYFIRKIIKNIKSSDKRLFININYVYLSNIQMKGKKEKYNKNILKIKNTVHFSIIRYNNNKKDKLVDEIIEEEPSNFNNNSNISNNSIDNKMEQNFKNRNSNHNNDKYLFSCVNFIIRSIKRIFIRNWFNYFKKRIKKLCNKY